MKQKLLYLCTLLCLLCIGGGNAWGENVTLDIAGTSKWTNNSVTKNGVTMTITSGNLVNNSSQTRLNEGAAFTITAPSGKKVVSANITSNSTNTYVAPLASTSSTYVGSTCVVDKTTATITVSQGYNSIVCTNLGGAIRVTSCVVTIADDNTPSSINASTDAINAPADGLTGKINVTWNNILSGSKYVAIFSDQGCENYFEEDWLTAELDADDNVTYSVQKNNETSARSAYIQIAGYKEGNNEEQISKVISVCQSAALKPAEYFTVTIVTPENGTLTIKDGETTINSGDEVEEGKTLTVLVQASDGYRFKNWGYKDGNANWVGNMTSTFTHVMPSAPCSFKATFEEIPTYTVAFSVNGTVVKSDTHEEGASVTAPTVDAINGKVFTGWVTTPSVDASSTPKYVTPSSTAQSNVTYYAVFATVSGNGEVEDKTITLDFVGDDWGIPVGSTNKVVDETEYSYGEYTIKLAGNTGNGFYMGTSNNKPVVLMLGKTGAYLKLPVLDTPIKKITCLKSPNTSVSNSVKWNVFSGENKASTEVTGCADGAVFIINEDYQKSELMIKVTNNYNTQFTGIEILTEGSADTYSEYTTLVGTYNRETKTGKYGTVCLPTTFTVEGANIYSVSGVNNDAVVLDEVAEITAGVPYLYQATADAQTFTLTGNSVAVPQNSDYLTGVFEPTKMYAGNYVLQTQEGVQGFYKVTETNNLTSPAYRCYLNGDQVPNGVKAFYFDGNATAIKAIETLTSGNAKIYDLNGRQQKTLQKGVNIVNGVKFIVK